MIEVLQFASILLTFAFLVFALIYAISRRSDGSSAKGLAVMGLTVMLLTHSGSYVFSFWIGRNASVANTAIAVSVYSIVSSLGFICALWMLVAAVFTKRKPADHVAHEGEDAHDREERMPIASENPYSSPTS